MSKTMLTVTTVAALSLFGVAGMGTPVAAQQNGLQEYFARQGLPGHFWADEEAHTIVSRTTATPYQICNLYHESAGGFSPDLRIMVDGEFKAEINQGRCIDVEGSEITVASANPNGIAHGSYHVIE